MPVSVLQKLKFNDKSLAFLRNCLIWGGILLILLLPPALVAPSLLKKANLSTVAYDAKGRLLGARISNDGQWRFPHSNFLPQKYLTCLLHYEDRRFYFHPGVDPLSLLRAALMNLRAGKIVSGGSTIDMQLARILCGHKGRTVWNKLVECWYAVGLELRFSKRTILEHYAASAPLGGNVVGLEAAMWRYFSKDKRDLTWAEAALLAVLPNQPSFMHLKRNNSRLLAKRNRLLHSLHQDGKIPADQLTLALDEPLPDQLFDIPSETSALLAHLSALNPGQHQFYTTIDRDIQEKFMLSIKAHASQLRANEIHNLSVLAIDNRNGTVLVYVPNAPETGLSVEARFVNNLLSKRSSGSILKPLLYLMAIERGIIHPGSILADIPTTIGDFSPENFSRDFHGAVRAKAALQLSLNIPAVRLLQEYGLELFYSQLKELGFTSFNRPASHYGLSLILGGGEVSAWELASVYSDLVFRLEQYHAQPDVRKWQRRTGLQLIAGAGPVQQTMKPEESLHPGAIYQVMEMMKGNVPDLGLSDIGFSRVAGNISWKTGTSFGFKDAWCVGLSPEYTLVVWMGNSTGKGRPGLIGVYTAAPLLFELASILDMRASWNPPVDLFREVTVCSKSGNRVNPLCPELDTILTVLDHPLFSQCEYHQEALVDPSGQFRVQLQCEPNGLQKVYFAFPPVMEFYYRKRDLQYTGLPPYRLDCLSEAYTGQREVEIVYPQPGTRIYLPIGFELRQSQVVFRAMHRDPAISLFWFVDGQFLGTTSEIHQRSYLASPGKHRLQVRDAYGNSATATFECAQSEPSDKRG
ncbi:MAG: Penicillin-binding protein 1C [Saprospiraceae bacterium]|jgi:penicillin-binding protein 1C|nr:penicillin-binding protein 1C [Saprospiraceae bacterium]MBV6473136.1 Penicillin-binding protein 1C [Saprospiraceae bacterium]